MRESLLLGSVGLIAFIAVVLHAWRRGTELSSVRFVALGLSAFALGVAVIICLARLQAFRTFPGEIFADRYLPWSCLFWFGIALYATAGESAAPRTSAACAAAAIAVAAIFLANQRLSAGWSATVSRHNQQSAAAAQLGIWDPQRFPDDRSAHRDDVLRSLALLRERRLSMYAEPEFELVQSNWRAPMNPATVRGQSMGTARVNRQFYDSWGNRNVASFEGTIPNSDRTPLLVVVDGPGALRGLAKISFIGPDSHSLRFNWATKHGFDGYVLNPHAGEELRILVLDPDTLAVLDSIPLRVGGLE